MVFASGDLLDEAQRARIESFLATFFDVVFEEASGIDFSWILGGFWLHFGGILGSFFDEKMVSKK